MVLFVDVAVIVFVYFVVYGLLLVLDCCLFVAGFNVFVAGG